MPVLLCACAVAGLLLSEARGWRYGSWLCKPVAAAAFLWAALSWGALETTYGQCVFAGLLLCACGDVLLIPRGQSLWFQLGIGAFLLGHVAYALAFVGRGLHPLAAMLASVGLALFAWRVLTWLSPHVQADFRRPVHAYVAVISAMVVTAIAASAAGGGLPIAVGAVAFALSDLSVARERFVQPGFANGAWGLPLYFGAQLVLAASVAPR
jgi:uncharacterized membrane protein YhhN